MACPEMGAPLFIPKVIGVNAAKVAAASGKKGIEDMCIREFILSPHNANHTVRQPDRALRRGPHRILSDLEGHGLK